MKTIKVVSFVLALMMLTGLLATPAHAIPVVGQTVAGVGDATRVGTQGSEGDIRFFIPLNDSEVYGNRSTPGTTGGMSSDSCTIGSRTSNCTGGTLDMFLFFDMPEAGTTTVQLDFTDLDVAGLNDPWYFIETLEVIDPDGNVLSFSMGDLLAGSNRDNQSLSFDLDISGPFYLHLTFTTAFNERSGNGTYTNTAEYLYATATTSVPEPGTLAMLGTGLLLLGFSRRRKSTRQN